MRPSTINNKHTILYIYSALPRAGGDADIAFEYSAGAGIAGGDGGCDDGVKPSGVSAGAAGHRAAC